MEGGDGRNWWTIRVKVVLHSANRSSTSPEPRREMCRRRYVTQDERWNRVRRCSFKSSPSCQISLYSKIQVVKGHIYTLGSWVTQYPPPGGLVLRGNQTMSLETDFYCALYALYLASFGTKVKPTTTRFLVSLLFLNVTVTLNLNLCVN